MAKSSASKEAIAVEIEKHWQKLGINPSSPDNFSNIPKQTIRNIHSYQKQDKLRKHASIIQEHKQTLLAHIPYGKQIFPHKITPKLVEIKGNYILS